MPTRPGVGGAVQRGPPSYREALTWSTSWPTRASGTSSRCGAVCNGASPRSRPAGSGPTRRSRTSRAAPSCAGSSGPRPEHLSAMTRRLLVLPAPGGARRGPAGRRGPPLLGGRRTRRLPAENALGLRRPELLRGRLHRSGSSTSSSAARLVPDGCPPTPARVEQNWLLPFDPLVITLTHLAVVRWITGRPREAHAAADRALARAATLPFPEGPFSMAYAKSYLAWTYADRRAITETAARLAGEVREIGGDTVSCSGRAPARSTWPWPSSALARRPDAAGHGCSCTPPSGSCSGPGSFCPMS